MTAIPLQIQGIVLGINMSFVLESLRDMRAKLLAAGPGKDKQRQVVEVEIVYLERNIDEAWEIFRDREELDFWLSGRF